MRDKKSPERFELMIVLFITLTLPLCLCALKCPYYNDYVVKENCDGCGVCQLDSTDKLKCFYDQLDYFNEGEYCNLVSYCKRKEYGGECKEFECLSMLGSFRCQCNHYTFGRLCEYEIPEGSAPGDYAVVDDIIFIPIITHGEIVTVSLLLSNVGKDFVLHLQTDFESFTFNSHLCEEVSKYHYCKKWYKNYPNLCERNANIKNNIKCALTMQFMFISSNLIVNDVYSSNNDAKSGKLGGKQDFNISIYNTLPSTKPVYNNIYTVIIIYVGPNFHYCDPTVAVRNVAKTMGNIYIFTVREEIVITGSHQLRSSSKCVNTDKVLRKWTVWKFEVNHNDLVTKPLGEIFEDPNLTFPPFSLSKGIYKIKLNVSVWVGEKESYQFTAGYFKVLALKLLPIITGGEERTVYYNVEFLKLDGSLSRNPNFVLSQRRTSLKFYWKCDKPIDLCKEKRSDYNITYTGPFEKNESYTFYLTVVSTKDKQLESTTSQRIHMSSTKQDSIEVLCKKNCGGSDHESNPANIIYLEAVVIRNYAAAAQGYRTFDWTYITTKEDKYKPVDEIRQSNTPDNVLIVLKNSLSKGETYLFQVKGKGEHFGVAKFKIKVARTVPTFSCHPDLTFSNNTILRGVTKFNVKCGMLTYNEIAPIYEFYDMHVGDTNDTGRLIVSGKSNIAFDVVLTRGRLVVEVTDEYGITGVTEIIANLQNTTNVTEIIQNELKNLKQNGSTSDAEFKTNKISIILDLVITLTHDLKDLKCIVEYILKVASEDEIRNVPILKIWTGLVNTIANKNFIGNYTTKSINYLSKVITKLSTKLLYEIRGGLNETETNDLTDEKVHKLSRNMLKICNTICNSGNKDIIKRRLEEEDSYSLHASYRESSDFLVRAVGRIMLSLALTVLPHESPIIMKEKSLSIWVKEDSPEWFSETANDSVTSVVIDKNLAKSLSQTSNLIIVQVAEYEDNPYWYNSEFDIHTHAIDLQIRYRKEDRIPFIEEVHHPVVLNLEHFETVTRVINGSVCQPYSNESLYMADLAVAIHHIRVPFTGRMNLKFLDLEEDEIFRLIVLFNKRPDYEYMTVKNVSQITKSSPLHIENLRDPHSHDVYDLYFVGILPGKNVPDGKCLNYSFELTALHCVTWKFHEWSTGGCTVKGTNSQLLQCRCEHLSTFAGFSQVPINAIDPFSDYTLLLGLKENPYVFIFLISLLSAYFILLIWALRKDRKEKIKGGAIYLEDNFPSDPFPYLVAVYTGNKLFSGTTSHVGIMIEGEEAGSRAHLLKSPSHRTLETGDDNWFIIFTPYHLGDLSMIHLWIDYSGNRPEWFCHKIMVVDLVTSKEYLFLVNSWMSLKEDEFIERFVEVSNPHDEHQFHNTIDNLILGFRETHLWLSVLARHPRSSVTRAQRLSLAFTGLLVTMLVSCMFYGVVDERKEDYPNFSLSMREFIVAVMSLVISSTLINIIVSLFRRTLVLKQYDEEYMLDVEEEDGNVQKSKSKKAKPKKKNPLQRLFANVLKIVTKPKKFKPVLLDIDEFKIKQKKKISDFCWSILSWSICISMICFCSYLIILYGLKFGKVKSLEWLTSVVLSLLQIICIVAPFRIISLATVSGILSTKMYEVVSYRIQPQILEKCKLRQLDSDPNLDKKLINIRSQQFYLPLSYKEVLTKYYKQRRKLATWLLLDMVLIFGLIVLMFFQNETLWTTKYYWNNQQLTSLLRQGYEEEGIQMYSLSNISQYSLFLDKDVFPVIYQSKWYNGMPIIDRSTTDDFRFVFGGTSKLFGLPRLRQIRLKPDICEKPIYENLSRYCNVKLSEDTEDTSLYAEGWVETGPSEKFLKLSPWNHMNDSETYDPTFFGYSNIAYKGGGYVAELDMTEEKAEDIVITLHREKWLDNRTSVVIFELTLYNGFSGTFSWLISVTENLHMGLLMNRVYVYTVSDSYKFPIIDIVFFVGLLTFAFRVFFVINRNGIDNLICNFLNLFEVIIVFLAIVCAVLFILNIYLKSEYLKSFMTGDDKENYFQYFHLLEYLDEFKTVLLFLVIFLACRFVISFRFGKRFTVHFDAIVYDLNRIIWIFTIFNLFLYTHWRIFSYLMNNYTLTKSSFLIISKVDFKQIVQNCSNVQCKISPFVLCSLSYIVQLIIVSYLVFTYRIVKRKSNEKEHLNFFTVFCEKHYFPSLMKDTRRKSKVLKLA